MDEEEILKMENASILKKKDMKRFNTVDLSKSKKEAHKKSFMEMD